jgi:GNAT superfamily N-acetyltransferase
MDVNIRPADQRDVPTVARLIGEIERYYGASAIQPLDEREAQVQQALFGQPPLASALLAEEGSGDLVGLAAYSYLWPAAGSTHSLFLKELYVRESARRHGIGALLMAELRAAAARPGCSCVEWMTDRDNSAARSFYRGLGFAEFDGKVVYRLDSAGV